MAIEPSHLAVYYLRITLKDSKPPIWRDILVPSDLTLDALHYVIQATMGWENSHLHQFIAEKVLYTDEDTHTNNRDDYGLDVDDSSNNHDRNEKQYTVSQLLTKETVSMVYEYDLGDSWMHHIELKKILPADVYAHQPRCIKGEQACPPEGCGGIWGYADMLESIQNAKNTNSDDELTWFGEGFNPNHFDIEEVNKVLKHLLISNTHS